jgi:iron complex transport system ATP-binding protein
MTSSRGPAIELREVSVLRGARAAVDRVSLKVMPSEFLAIVGPNGAGKSTLLRAMAGLCPHEGEIRLAGDRIGDLLPVPRARGLAYLPEEARIHWPLRVADVVALGRAPHKAFGRQLSAADRAAVAEALIACDLEDFAERRATALSGGETARVLFARALAVQAPLLIVDEPVAHLDPLHQLALMRLLVGETAKERAVIVVLHDIALAMRFASRVVTLKDGRIEADGSPSQILATGALDRAFGLKFTAFAHGGAFHVVPADGPIADGVSLA